jgi:glycosyltransferase involved in cell wall biosynthesis
VGQVSVVIPVHDGGDHLREAIESAFAQTLPPAAVIVVDDGSTDETPGVASGFADRVRYLRQDHAGAAQARNRGVELVETEYLAFLDADDVWEPHKLERQVAELCAFERPAMVFGLVVQFASPELTPEEAASLRFEQAPMPAISASALLMRTAVFRAVGAFDPALRTGEFIEWYGRAGEYGIATRIVAEILLGRRLHRNNHGRVRSHLRGGYARALKAVLDRRRAQSR